MLDIFIHGIAQISGKAGGCLGGILARQHAQHQRNGCHQKKNKQFVNAESRLWSMIKAMMVGSSTSIMASSAAKSGVLIEAALYSPRCDTSFLII